MGSRSRPTIAYLTTAFAHNSINFSIWTGISALAREEDVNVICLPGNPPNSPIGFDSQANAVYNLVHKETVQGLLFWGGGIWGQPDPEDVKKFYKRFSAFPVVNISTIMESLPSVIIDNYQGMYQACLHLIEQHHCRHIAFIRGPESHQEAEARFQAYQEALRAHGLPFDSDLVIEGLFSTQSGEECVRSLLDERRVSFDSIAAASDLMAIGALSALRARGREVPDEVKVVGFDDIDESRSLKIPLTTVRQPFYELGRAALKKLLACLRHESYENITVVPSCLVVRQSCGCLHPIIAQQKEMATRFSPKRNSKGRKPVKEKIYGALREELVPLSVDQILDEKTFNGIFNSLMSELTDAKNDLFLPALNRALVRFGTAKEIAVFHSLLTILRRSVLPYVCADNETLTRAENLWQQGRTLIGDYVQRLLTHEVHEKSIQVDLLQDIGQDLTTAFNIGELMNTITRRFSDVGVKSCFLSLYDDPAGSQARSRLILAYVRGKQIPLKDGGVPFDSRQLVPDELFSKKDKYAFIVEPLYFKYEQLGFAVFEESLMDGPAYELLRSQLSVAVKSALLFQDKERLLVHVESRARELQLALDQLKRSHEELEQFSYIASHDLREPLRKMSAFSMLLKNKYSSLLDDAGRDYLARIENAAVRMQRLIIDLLEYSRLTTKAQPFQKVALAPLVRDVLSDIEVLIEKEKAVIEMEALPELEAEPLQMRQLFQNLITNAIKFHKPGESPVVKISRARRTISGRECCVITIEDNGIGIEEKHFDKIFVIFQRLHTVGEYEGTGIGLALCKKVVERHRGQIKVESALGKGSKFIITLPVSQTVENVPTHSE